jgi:hypothetical protein
MSLIAPSRRLFMAALFAAALLLATTAHAGDTDAHLSHDSMGVLFQHSVFAHGYIHGYEEGFHWGNLDFQTGRSVSRPKEGRASKSSYEKTFGSRPRFKAGYHRGFLAGYRDGQNGRQFRAHDQAKEVARGLAGAPADAKHLAAFDTGLSDGYDLGAVHGENASRDDDEYDATTTLCSPGSKEHGSHPPLYCAGFARGYTMGYSDGYLGGEMKPPKPATAARK